ncbi:MAG: 8-oxo-dGTP diphosphatase [Candidatus Liptonbacteria bacterium]|nr:8-oxo-dGTP diphosphatase [Candidatus Liptonbacteria bacterium]
MIDNHTKRQGTLCFLIDGERVLLAMKKRGLGTGKWNGSGGKVKPGETIEAAAVRELREEVGVKVPAEELQKVGFLMFRNSYTAELNWDVHVFFIRTWQGEPSESEEMRPQWFYRREIPFDQMWVDDQHWLPPVLAGKQIEAEFHFNPDGSELERFEIREVQPPPGG